MASKLRKAISSRLRQRKRRRGSRPHLRPILEHLESRLVLAADWIHYDYVEDGELKGGVVQADPENPLHVAVDRDDPPPPPLQSTTIIDSGPSANRIDLVIVGDGYTASELNDYAAHVDNVVADFFAESPLDEYASFFNVHRVDVISNESGVDNDPTQGIDRDTALDAGFWCGNIERLLCVDVTKTLDAANNAPDVDQVLVVANTTKYGGAGISSANIGTLSGDHPSAVELALHEFGHSFANLADEYYTGGTTYNGSEPSRANVSIHDAAALDNLDTKWHHWLDESNVDAFEGGTNYEFGVYRPTLNSKMRSLGQPFEQVNVEQFVLTGYETVKPIDDATPAGTYDGSTTFFVTPVAPATHDLSVEWLLDGSSISGATATTLDASSLNLPFGSYTLTARVVDGTSLVRDETQRDTLLTEERSWTLDIAPDISITDAYLVDQQFNRLTTPVVGERMWTRVNFETNGLPADAAYRIEFLVNGIAINVDDVTSGAGLGLANWWYVRSGWYARPGTNNVSVVLDADNTVGETNESNNSMSFSFTPVAPTTLPDKFIWPVEGAPFTDTNIGNYVDVDPTSGILDYTGSNASYDGHTAWDIGPGNFREMDLGIELYAAADGTVTAVNDGEYDRQTAWLTPSPPANYVIIDHGAGWQTIYWHLRRDSLQVEAGQTVSAGDFLGYMGSSGVSTGTHLHFGVRHEGRAIEPNFDPDAYFVDPLRYVGDAPTVYRSGLTNYIATSHVKERGSDVEIFDQASGQFTYVWARFSGLREDDLIEYVWIRPDNSVYTTGSRTMTRDYSGSWWWFSRTLPTVPDLGTWRVEFRVNGTKLGEETFEVTVDGAPELRVEDAGAIILDDRYTPVDFGDPDQNAATPTKTFTVINHGSDTLTLSDLSVPTPFSITEGLSTSLSPGQSDTFTVSLGTATAGSFAGEVRFTTNDADESDFNFSIEGTVVAAALETLVLGISERWATESEILKANVRRSGSTTNALTVTLTSGDLSEVSVPATVTIPAGEDRVSFTLSAVDDNQPDPDRLADVFADATGYAPAQNSLLVLDSGPPVPGAIFYDSFENGLLNNWTILDLGNEARVEIRDLYTEGVITNAVAQQFGDNGNESSLAFDSTRASGDNIKDLGIAILSVDLSGLTDGLLTFHHFEGADNNDLLPDQHTTTTPGDGVSVSRDGTNWYRLINVDNFDINRSGDSLWQLQEFDLGLEFDRINTAFSAGLQFDDNIQFKFSQYDDLPLLVNGWAIDEVTIQVEAQTFSLDRPKGAFHRFNLAGEDDDDYYFRAAVYGNVDANTPVMVAVHGSNGDNNINGYSWRWQKFVADPANGVDSMIVITPAFVENVAPGRFNTPVRYTGLSWNTADDAAADLALLDTVDSITATGIGDGSGIYLWGFSAGGQFVGRFTAAHPDRVAAAVVGGPSSQILPTEFVTFRNGLGTNSLLPAPAGVSLEKDAFLASRIMYWVGQDDSDPNHSQLERNPSIDSAQGISRRERAIYQFEQMHLTARQQVIDPRDYEFELLISEGDGHGWSSSDIPEIHEFLFRDRTPGTLPIQVQPRIVLSQSVDDRQAYLPQNVDRILPGQDFFVELWIDAPAGGTTGVESGELELFFDTTLADVLGMEHGLFSSTTSGVLDEAAGRIRNFGGSTTLSGVGVNEYALFGRIAMTAGGAGLVDPSRFAIALQRHAAEDFVLDGGQSHRTDLLPFPTTHVGAAAQGVTDAIVQGVVFRDFSGDGVRQADEVGFANREIQLQDTVTGQLATADFHLEPDESEGHGAYLYDAHAWVKLSAVGSTVVNPGVRAYDRGSDESSTGTHVFAHRTDGGFNTQWVGDLRDLRMDFIAPTQSVSIDIVAKLGDPLDFGLLEVYDSAGTLLESKQSSNLADGAFETVTITRPQADIAYAIATGAGGNNVRLDNLLFTSELRADTDADGVYVFDQLPPADYTAVLTEIPQWATTAPISGEFALSLSPGDVATSRNFGSTQQALSIAIVAASISEFGGLSTATVSRDSAELSQPLTVSLSSDDPTEATVPVSVTIPADQTSVTFTITAIDDNELDGTQIATILATAPSFASGSDTVDVTDHETLTLAIDPTVMSEQGGTVTGTVTRNNTDISQALVVNLSSSDTTEAAVATTVTILPDSSSANFTVVAVDDNLRDGIQPATITASHASYTAPVSETVFVTDHETLGLSIQVASISENGDSTTATVTRSDVEDLSQALTVTLASSDNGEASVPPSVTISVGQPSATFSIVGVDDDLLDGTARVTITASASGYTGAAEIIDVTDHETLTLSIAQDSISENGGTAIATLERSNTDITQALTVSLASSNTNQATVPTSVTIPADQATTTFTVTAIDDALLDGTQTVTITATHLSYAVSGSDTVDVTDHESLSLTINPGSISELGGTAVGIVTRSNTGDLSQALTVNVASDDTTEAAVPATVEIPANQASATFPITAVGDALLDGTQTATITATHAGYAVNGSDTIDVTDHESLSVSITPDTISEHSGTATGTVTRSTSDDLSLAIIVDLESDDTSEATVPATVEIPANQASATFPITAVDDTLLDGPQTVAITATHPDFSEDGRDTVDVTDHETLSVSIAVDSISEAGGVATGTVTRNNTDLTQGVTVNLSSNDTGEATVPGSVTILPNQTDATFTINAVNDAILDGAQVVTITTAASGYLAASDTVEVTDHETLTLAIAPDSISEVGGTATATVTRGNTDITLPLTVDLFNNDTSEATVPPAVTILANQASATFTIDAVDDDLLDGTQTVIITSSATGYVDGTNTLYVTDRETLTLAIAPASISENGGTTTGTVTRNNTDVTRALTVMLASDDTGEATVSPTVTIPANEASATFPINAVDDDLLDGPQTVTITTSASGYVDATNTVEVTDHETLTLAIAPDSISEAGGTATGTVTRGNTDLTQSLTVDLSNGGTNAATVPASVTILANEASATFAIDAVDDDLLDGTQTVTITSSGTGYVDGTDTLDVTDHETLTVTIDANSVSEDGGATTATVTRNNTNLDAPLTVTLALDDETEASVSPTITILADQSSATFTIAAVDDNLLDGTQTTTVTASASGYVEVIGSSDSVQVTDHETLTLAIDAVSIAEDGMTTATVSRSNVDDLSAAISVVIHISDSTEASIVSSTVSIEAGFAAATFAINGIEDRIVDSDQTITLSAERGGYAGGSDTLRVTDIDGPVDFGDAPAPYPTSGLRFPDGSFDAAFGGNGQVITGGFAGSGSRVVWATALQADGKILAAGAGDHGRLSVSRYLPDGSLDTSFGTAGHVGLFTYAARATLAVQSDGKIVLGVASGFTNEFGVLRLTADGSPDNSFGTDGGVFQPGDVFIRDLLIQPDGAIVLAVGDQSETNANWTIARFSGSGAIDASFGTGGVVETDFDRAGVVDPSDHLYSVALLPDGRLLAGGSSAAIFALAQYLPDGSLDTSYADNGLNVFTIQGGPSPFERISDLKVLPDGKVLAASGNGGAASLIRFNPDGSLDNSFDDDGFIVGDVPWRELEQIEFDSAGRILGLNSSSSIVARLLPDGTADTSFGSSGSSQILSGGPPSSMKAFVVQPDGKVVLGGSEDISQWSLVRLDSYQSGAQHTVGSLHLGAAIDAEKNGQPSANADGDDDAGVPDDEDGVAFTTPLVLGQSANIEVIASGIGRLDAWLDFNDDGDWDDAGEQIFASELLAAGTNSLSFALPASSQATPLTFARFRFSSAGGLGVDGLSVDGEVEDYAISILGNLGLAIASASISENAGTTTATITRTHHDLSQPLTVNLSNSDTTEATLPLAVEIPANAASATFTITALDDALLDGTVGLTVTATANGFASATAALDVTDHEELTLTIDTSSISENGGATTATITRSNTDDLSQALIVDLASDNTTEATVPATVEIPAEQASATFAITAVDDALLDGTQTVLLTAAHVDYLVTGSGTLTVTDHETLTVVIDAASISEHGGTAIGTVTRSNTDDLSQALTVALASDDISEAAVPATVEIPANQASAAFTINAVDDALLDGVQTVTITATDLSYAEDGDHTLDVTDHETLGLLIDLASISEQGGTATGTVTRSDLDDLSQALTVDLSSHDASEATVPATVEIQANQASVTFTITAIDDALLDGTQTVRIKASNGLYVGADDTLDVTDQETLTISIVADSISEQGGSTTATVSRSNVDDLSQPLTISLGSDDLSEATVPATVEIPANAAFTTFTITAVDENLLDGTQTVVVTALAAGYVAGSDSTDVTDHETLTLTLDAAAISERLGSTTATVTRSNIDDLSQTLTVNLAGDDLSEASVPATVEIPANEVSATFAITAVDDSLLDGTQSVSLTAAAFGYLSVLSSLDVTDYETLSVVIDAASVSEAGGVSTATVTRSNSDLALPLTVQLSSGDVTEATVPGSVTIPADASSVEFAITAVDDASFDGLQTVAITSTAGGYVAGSDSLGITDHEALTVTIDTSSLSEAGGSANVTITRSNTDDVLDELSVRVFNTDSSEASVPAFALIPAASASVTFPILGVDDQLLDGPQSITIRSTAAGYATESATVLVEDHETLTISIEAASISEAGGATIATITRSNLDDLNAPLVVSLASDDVSEAIVPASVTIPANSASADFSITAVDDDLLDGMQVATIAATAAGYFSGAESLEISDLETLTLAIDVTSVSEFGGTSTGTITRSNTDDLSQALVVDLASDDTSEAAVPATVEIPANQASATFTITAVDDALLDGTQTVLITAAHVDYAASGSDSLDVTDHETLELAIAIDSISENGGSTSGIITRSNTDDLSQALTVSLASDDTSEAAVPATVEIPANQASATFTITAVDDALLDGTQTVLITAAHADYAASSSHSLDVTDHETLDLVIAIDSISENGGSTSGIITRSNTDDLSQALTVSLASDDTSEAAVPATVEIPANQASATFTITAVDDALLDGTQTVLITAAHVDYAANGSDSLDVTDHETLELVIDAASISENGGSTSGIITRSNTDDLSQVLTVSLASDDTSEAAVLATVEIPANQASATFTITAVDDALLDGTQTVLLTASHVDYAASGSDSLDVTDHETLELVIAAASISENGGSTSGIITRSNTDDLSQALTVSLTSDDTSEAAVPATVEILANQASATFTITAVDDALLDGTQTVLITATHVDYAASSSDSLDVTDHETLDLAIAADSISENGGSASGTITRSNTDDLSQALTVSLTSDDTSEAAVPATVEIPANQASATFTITAVDDALLDGTQTVLITAAHVDYAASGSDSLEVTDHETLELAITAASISENGGATSGIITRSDTDDLSQALTVSLTSDDTSEAAVPATVEIPANQASATFTITAADDALLDGTQTVLITAAHVDYAASGSDSLDVTDHETLELVIAAASISENGGSTSGIITRSNTDDLSQALTVSLTSDDTSEAAVPATVEIRANQASATFTITAVDDALLDGTQTVLITAAHVEYAASGSDSLDVTDHETLELAIDAGSISESGGSTSGIITRGNTDDLSQALTVTLTSDDTSEAAVPATIEIPANQASATFTITAADDALLDGTQTVLITAAHVEYAASGSDSLDVTDHETLTLAINADSISETGGSTSGIITRGNTDDLSQALTVSLTSDDTSEAAVPATVEIPANQASATFTITAVDDALLDGTQTVLITAAHIDYAASGSDSLDVTDHETLDLAIDAASISESGGSTSGIITRSNTDDLSQSLTVTLTSDDTSEAAVPATVEIPANQASATFTITAVDDALLDGTQTVLITAAHVDYAASGNDSLDVTDHETVELAIAAGSISENGGSASGIITRSNTADLSQALTVSLTSDDTSEAAVPATVEIPANQASATFTITAVDDALLDGTQTVLITAAHVDYVASGSDSLDVTDHETLELAIDAGSISESGGSTSGIITRSNTDDLSQALTVSLTSDDTSEAAVPATVEIPANQASTTFTITAVDDALLDGTQTVLITAAHVDYAASGSDSLDVTDHETLELAIAADSISENGGSASGTITRSNTDDLSQALTVSLTSDDTSEAAVPATVEILANQASAAFTITAVDDALLDGTQTVLLTAAHVDYAGSGSDSLDVTDHETLDLAIDAASISENGGSASGIITRSNTDDLSQALTVSLTSDDTSEAAVPATVEIPANQASTPFTITAVDDALLDGTQTVLITAAHVDYAASGNDSLDVTDHETVELAIAAASISESGGSTNGIITRSSTDDLSQALTVTLASGDTSEAAVPATVEIPANQASTTFTITAVDDALLDGTQTVLITAAHVDYAASGSDSLDVSDHEPLGFSLDATAVMEHGVPIAGTVRRDNTDIDEPLVVSLVSSQPAEVVLPATVTIPGGESSVSLTVAAAIDAVQDGTQAIEIVASASGYAKATVNLDVTDNPFPWHYFPAPKDVNTDGSVSPIDALIIINEANEGGSRQLPLDVVSVVHFYDVNADGFLSPLDALIIVNFLNGVIVEGEGEASKLRAGEARHEVIDVADFLALPPTSQRPTSQRPDYERLSSQASVRSLTPPPAAAKHDPPRTGGQRRQITTRSHEATADLEEIINLIAEDVFSGEQS